MPQQGGLASPGTGTTPSVSTGSVSNAASADAASCSQAISKINDALELSAALSQKSGGKTTTRDIMIVLVVLEKSLGKQCSNLVSSGPRDMVMERAECTMCERALYGIVKQLEKIFASTANETIPGNSPFAEKVQAVRVTAMSNDPQKRRNGNKC